MEAICRFFGERLEGQLYQLIRMLRSGATCRGSGIGTDKCIITICVGLSDPGDHSTGRNRPSAAHAAANRGHAARAPGQSQKAGETGPCGPLSVSRYRTHTQINAKSRPLSRLSASTFDRAVPRFWRSPVSIPNQKSASLRSASVANFESLHSAEAPAPLSFDKPSAKPTAYRGRGRLQRATTAGRLRLSRLRAASRVVSTLDGIDASDQFINRQRGGRKPEYAVPFAPGARATAFQRHQEPGLHLRLRPRDLRPRSAFRRRCSISSTMTSIISGASAGSAPV